MMYRIRRAFQSLYKKKNPYPSETSKVRHLILPYCVGKGCDIGFGGDKIVKSNCDGIDLPSPYAFTGFDAVDIPCEVGVEPIPAEDHTYDYVYSSHLIEDFEDTASVLTEFCRILKPGGYLILVFPDQQEYEKYCTAHQLWPNTHHKHAEMGLKFMMDRLDELKQYRFKIEFTSNCEIDYNVVLVMKVD